MIPLNPNDYEPIKPARNGRPGRPVRCYYFNAMTTYKATFTSWNWDRLFADFALNNMDFHARIVPKLEESRTNLELVKTPPFTNGRIIEQKIDGTREGC